MMASIVQGSCDVFSVVMNLTAECEVSSKPDALVRNVQSQRENHVQPL